jgi:REP element-mobilizing transposase RayT
VPSGLKRFQKAASLHFITFSCFHRLPLLDTPGTMETVEAVLEQARARHQARVYAYVLMPEHVHLLVNEPPQIVLAQFLKAVKQITSRRLRGSRQKFWQERRVAQVPGSVSSTTEDGCPMSGFVKSQDMVYKVSRDILYTFQFFCWLAIKRSTIVERFIVGSSSRTRVVQ